MGTMKVGVTKFEIAKYDGRTNHFLWERKVNSMLKATGIGKLLKTKPEDVPEEDWNNMQEMAVNKVMLYLQPHVIRQLEQYGDCLSLFEALQRKYHQKELSNRLYTSLKLMSFKMKDGNTKEQDHIDAFNDPVLDLQNLGDELSDEIDGVLQVKARDKVVLKGNKYRNLYVLEGNNVCEEVNVTRSRPEMSQIWHSRMGHMNDKYLILLREKDLLSGLGNIDLDFCEHCFMGKHHRKPFGVGIPSSKELEEQEVIGELLIRAPDDEDQQETSARRSSDRVSRAPISLSGMLQWSKRCNLSMTTRLEKLVKLPPGQQVLDFKWIYKLKDNLTESVGKIYKARLVAKGFTQEKSVDYMSLDEIIFMKQPISFVKKSQEEIVCILLKSLYGLEQAPRQWNKRFDDFMCTHDFKRSLFNPCVYMKRVSNENFGFIILVLYVDDMLIAARDRFEMDNLKSLLSSEFRMKDLGTATRILGMEIHRDKNGKLWLTQGKYARKVLVRFNMENCKPINITLASHFKLSSAQCPTNVIARGLMSKIAYDKAVGSLMYLMISTILDIAMAMGKVSRYMSNPGKMHWEAVKWILRYLKGTMDYGLLFGAKSLNAKSLIGYVDVDYGQDLDERYVLRVMYLHLEVMNNWVKRIDIQYHFIREAVSDKKIELVKIDGKLNPADAFIRVIPLESFARHRLT
ncbi:hypothetical protein AXG93_1712s1530 [Marchantia polymorpha subsp. ruderalis]|uniref:Reverse transcriptase Ty1/copia-type domain-containing protein n=1 Tax=Marchantia polymorpha subsp. ruderalis TaxID=1480154 RepID=A0A176W005_MARPO|nr:hypothetical protein AXG93_1712s1530 [Marchantia polymorpha subsp. ruderalis]